MLSCMLFKVISQKEKKKESSLKVNVELVPRKWRLLESEIDLKVKVELVPIKWKLLESLSY